MWGPGHGLDTVMLIAELEADVKAAKNATPSQVDTAIALIRRVKHAFEVPQLPNDPGLASAMRTAPLNFNAEMKSACLRLWLWCSETKQMREFDDPCRHMTERLLSKYILSTHVNSCESFSSFAEAHDIAIERYLEPESLEVADSDCRSDFTSSDDNVVPSAEFPKPAPLTGETFRVGDTYLHACDGLAHTKPSLTNLMPSS
eukprot:3518081-Pleurochrysis_carterae.AAC.2